MNEHEEQRTEAILRGIAPAQPPADFMARMVAAGPVEQAEPPAQHARVARRGWLPLLRWLVPATAVVVAGLGIWRFGAHPAPPARHETAGSTTPTLTADEVHIDRELVSAFDAVGQMTNGEPVRFHCQQWMDNVELRDTARGLVVQQQRPRLEVLPVSFEPY